ncbi:MAG: chlorophyll synthesis pathway protein BchC [Pseudomonadota bacterium]
MINSARSVPLQPAEDPQRTVDLAQALDLSAHAIRFAGDHRVSLERLALTPLQDGDLVVDVDWSGVSTGTERLLWSSEMPPFPGLSYPLVPGYEAVGRVVHTEGAPDWMGAHVFVPGANCYRDAAGLFGASASRVILPESRAVRLGDEGCQSDVLLALAATAHHAIAQSDLPQLIIGHGVLGRLVARLVVALGGPAPTVWETNPERHDAEGYRVLDPDEDTHRAYAQICDVSGSVAAIDAAIGHAAKSAEIVLAGFYSDRVAFDFPPAFMREISFRIAAEWQPEDMQAVMTLRRKGLLSLDGLITHVEDPTHAERAYQTAFGTPDCLKLILDWRAYHDDAA